MKKIQILIGLSMISLVFAQKNTVLKIQTQWEMMELSGVVEAKYDHVLMARTAAQVKALPFAQGDNVQHGDVVIQLDDRKLNQQLASIDQAIAAQKSALKYAKLQQARMKRLVDSGAIAKIQWEQTSLATKSAKAGLGKLIADRAGLEEQAAFINISAISTGQLVELMVRVGDSIMPGMPLGRIRSPQMRTIKVSLPAWALKYTSKSQWLIGIGEPNQWHKANVSSISQTPTKETGSYIVYLDCEQPIQALTDVRVMLKWAVEGLFVHQNMVEQRGNMSYLTILKKNKKYRRLVKIGPVLDNGWVQIIAGVQAGETIITNGDGHE